MSALDVIEHVKGEPWTEAQVRAEAAKYKTRTEFQKMASGAHGWARKNGILKGLMESQLRSWNTEESVTREASKYLTKNDFQLGCVAAYRMCLKRFPHILQEVFIPNRQTWDDAAIRAVAQKYQTKAELRAGNPGGYLYASRHGLLKDLFPDDYVRTRWDDASVRLEASKYLSKKAFSLGCSPAYGWAIKNKIIDELFENQLTMWTEDLVRAEAEPHSTKFEFQKGNPSAYVWARKNGILEDLGLVPGTSAFLSDHPSLLYIVDTVLTDGSEGIMFGITNRDNPRERYLKVDKSQMTNRYAYKFPTGSEARAIESRLKREFKDHHITAGLSPFKGSVGSKGARGGKEKKGTTGEILYAAAGRENLEAIVQGAAQGEPFAW